MLQPEPDPPQPAYLPGSGPSRIPAKYCLFSTPWQISGYQSLLIRPPAPLLLIRCLLNASEGGPE